MTQLNRSIERWKGCDPAYMATEQSPAAITYAFIDAKHDILALAEVLRQIAGCAFDNRSDSERCDHIFRLAVAALKATA